MPKSSILVSSDHSTFSQAFSESFRCSLAGSVCTYFLEQGDLVGSKGFSPLRRSVTNFLLGDCGPSCLEIINKILPCSSGLIPHCSHDHPYPMRWDFEWSSRTRGIDGYFVFLPFPNNRTYSCLFLTKLLADGLAAHSSLVQGYNLVPDVLCQLFGLARGSGDVGMEDTDSMDRSFIHTTSWN